MMRRNHLLQVLVLVFTGITIAVNALAEIVPFNGKTVADISDSIHHYFVPSGYVFSIWGLIYLALVVFAFYQMKHSLSDHTGLVRIRPVYILSCIANCAWIVLWHYGYYITTVAVMAVILCSLIAIYQLLGVGRTTVSDQERWYLHAPFSLYLGWISVATVANISATLTVYHWQHLGIPTTVWASAMIFGVLLLTVAMLWRRNDVIFVLVVIWSIIGIGVHFSDQPIIASTSVAVVAMLAGMIGIKMTAVQQTHTL